MILQRKIICLLIFILPGYFTVAQQYFYELNFRQVDSFVQTVKFENDYIRLAADLTAPYAMDIYKTRAIFKWITNNIQYDYRFINSGKEFKGPDCEPGMDCIGLKRQWENNAIKKILRTHRAIAEGYAMLFKKLCNISYIQCEIIPGYARTKPYQIGNNMSVNHCWNAVMIDTSWYYTDLCQAAGHCIEDEESGRLMRFVKEFDDYYWLASFDRFSRNHYPKKSFDVERTNLNKEEFFNKPHYYSTETLRNITEHSPLTGVLKVKKGDTIHFDFDYKKEIKQLQVNSNIFRNPSLWTMIQTTGKKTKLVKDAWAEKKQVYIPFIRIGNRYRFDYVVNDNSLYYLDLIFNYKAAMRYRVRVDN